MNKWYLLFFTFMPLLLAACQEAETPSSLSEQIAYPVDATSGGYPAPQELAESELPVTPVTEISTPQPGLAAITGRVISDRSGNPVVSTPVRLAEVYYEGDQGAYVLDGGQSPGTLTDGEGRFLLVDIPAGDYVIVVGNIEVNDYFIIAEPSGRARVWAARENEVLDVEVLRVRLQHWD